MNELPAHLVNRPRRYRPRVSTYWWLWRWRFLKFILRELSSVAVAYFVILMLMHLYALRQGPAAYTALQQWLKSPAILALNTMGFVFVLFHTLTWFDLAPRAMMVRVRGKRVPDLLIAMPGYFAWIAVSVLVGWIILGG